MQKLQLCKQSGFNEQIAEEEINSCLYTLLYLQSLSGEPFIQQKPV